MEKIGLFWGSNTGNQEEAAGFLKDYMEYMKSYFLPLVDN